MNFKIYVLCWMITATVSCSVKDWGLTPVKWWYTTTLIVNKSKVHGIPAV